MAPTSLPTRVFILTTSVLSLLLLVVLLITGLLARESVIDQATSDIELLADVIERTIERDSMVPNVVETLVGEDMATTAEAIAGWVTSFDDSEAGVNALREQLKSLVERSNLDEVWVTDSSGYAYLSTVDDVDFTFSPSPQIQPQASVFYPLLEGTSSAVIQETRKREIDDRWFKYVGVGGLDVPRIVQVGREASDINDFRMALGVADLIRVLLRQSSIEAIYIVDENLIPMRGGDVHMAGLAGFSQQERALMQRMFDAGETVTQIGSTTINVASPILTAEGVSDGAFYVSLSRGELDQLLARILRISTLLFVVGGALSALVSYVVSKRLATPIWELTKAAAAVQSGNYRDATQLSSSRDDASELGRLRHVFQDMALKVEVREQELDDLVRVRTEELRTKNHLLEKSQAVIGEQLLLARDLQQATLPTVFPAPLAGLQGAARMTPALQVGGDFFDSFPVSGGRIGVVIADVSGKGVAAAFFAATAKNALREVAATEASPAVCLTQVNEILMDQNPILLFVTLNYAVFDVATKKMTLATAGHPSPIICDGSGTTRRVSCPLEPALGIVPDVTYTDVDFALSDNDAIVFFTDGITEAENSNHEELTEAAFEQFLATQSTASPSHLLDRIYDRVTEHAGDAAQSDDITAAIITLS